MLVCLSNGEQLILERRKGQGERRVREERLGSSKALFQHACINVPENLDSGRQFMGEAAKTVRQRQKERTEEQFREKADCLPTQTCILFQAVVQSSLLGSLYIL